MDFSPGYTSFPTVKGWVNPLKYTSPDYFNTCAAPNSGVHVPEAAFGYQRPRTGNAFGGVIAWEESRSGSIYRFGEYMQCRLLSPLQAGKKYCVNFFVSPSIAQNLAFNYVAMDEIGINFSANQVSQATGEFLSLPYHIVSPFNNFLSDTAGWIKINGIYTATGGEQWLTLGRFNNTGTAPNSIQVIPSIADPALAFRSYLYVDDVSVYLINNTDTIAATYDSSYCNTTALPMTLTSSGYDGNFMWSTGSTAKQIIATAPGTYWCTAISDCRIYMDTFIVRYDPYIKLDLGRELVNCNNQPVTIKPNNIYSTYKWSTGETTGSITAGKPGTYWLQAENKCGIQTDTVRVYIQPETEAPAGKDTMLCQLVNDPTLNIKGEQLHWYTHPLAVIGSPLQPYVYTKEVSSYTLYVTQTRGKCESAKTPVNITIKYQPRHELDDQVRMCQQALEYIGKEYPGVKYAWSSGATVCCIQPQYEGLYRVAVSNECGTYVDSTRVSFSLCDDCISVPNAFTPNGDGLNDKFYVTQTCPVMQYHIRIYDRWGKLVFETRDVKQAWTGTITGEYVNQGMYIYIIEYRSLGTKMDKFLKGNISLLR